MTECDRLCFVWCRLGYICSLPHRNCNKVISKNTWLDEISAVTSMPEREYCNPVVRERLVGETRLLVPPKKFVSNTLLTNPQTFTRWNILHTGWHYFNSRSLSKLLPSLVDNSTHTYTWWCTKHSCRDTLGTICFSFLWVCDSCTHLHFKSWSAFYQLHALTLISILQIVSTLSLLLVFLFLFTAADVNEETSITNQSNYSN